MRLGNPDPETRIDTLAANESRKAARQTDEFLMGRSREHRMIRGRSYGKGAGYYPNKSTS